MYIRLIDSSVRVNQNIFREAKLHQFATMKYLHIFAEPLFFCGHIRTVYITVTKVLHKFVDFDLKKQ